LFAEKVKADVKEFDEKKEILKATSVQVISSYSELPQKLKKPYEEMTVEELIQRAAYGSPNLGRPFKTGWIVGQLRTRASFASDVHELARIKGFKQGWVHRQLTN